jgi:hypothetical protein
LTLVVATALITVVPAPTGPHDGDTCMRMPITRSVDPDPTNPGGEFFDEGTACKADARDRVMLAFTIAVMGGGLTAATAVVARFERGQRLDRSPRLTS